ncbi:Hypothetical protein (plasmid) [Pseudomonas putida]|nr:Hypothetical protein [Pseudomonas putida]
MISSQNRDHKRLVANPIGPTLRCVWDSMTAVKLSPALPT